jgi:hypothetical protein
MSRVYSSRALRSYAAEQLACADVILAKHAEAALSLCKCGRPHPCDERQRWRELYMRYSLIMVASEDSSKSATAW